MANLVICCDGTWNTPKATEDGRPAQTNVVKLYNAVAERDLGGRRQKTYYHPGVGTEGGKLARLLGGGLGTGLDRNIKGAYRWLAQHYRPGDDVFLFGFSRGAYTVRSLGGVIAHAGLLDLGDPGIAVPEVWRRVDMAYDCYRGRTTPAEFRTWPRHPGTPGKHGFEVPPLHFVGVWDTVGSLGMPDDIPELRFLDDPSNYRFHNTALGGNVAHARHALAIDESRRDFRPTLWQPAKPDQDLVQLWFAGCHSDVGGGFADTGLSDGALAWMMDEARRCGLAFRPGASALLKPDPQAYVHDPLDGLFARRPHAPRSVPPISSEGTAFHHSVARRFTDPPLHERSYWPSTPLREGVPERVSVYARDHWNATGFVLEKGVAYRLEAEGEWIDWYIKCGPDGPGANASPIGIASYRAADFLNGIFRAAQRLRGGDPRYAWLSRRRPESPWMALVAVVANDAGGPEGVQPFLPEEFEIGHGCTFTPKATGYLYAFANDLWYLQGNNRGSVQLTVTRLPPVAGS